MSGAAAGGCGSAICVGRVAAAVAMAGAGFSRVWVPDAMCLHAARITYALARQGGFSGIPGGPSFRMIATPLHFDFWYNAALVFIFFALVGDFNGYSLLSAASAIVRCMARWPGAGARILRQRNEGKATFLLPGLRSFCGMGMCFRWCLQLRMGRAILPVMARLR